MNRRTSLVVAAVLVACAPLLAHPPGADGQHSDQHLAPLDPSKVRLWTNAKSGEVVRGAFLAARRIDGALKVSIERENGDVVLFAFDDLSEADKAEAQKKIDDVKAINETLAAASEEQPGGGKAEARKTAAPTSLPPPPQAGPFNAFAPFVTTRWDDRWLYVESDGLPHVPGGKLGTYVYSHPLMVGITAWQQQVPLPQRYTGANAWQIPLKPELADKPISAKDEFFRGAIALAANGVPIFNPIKNDGRTDTFIAGELDDFGGHCGRADDYHYHIAPTHLQQYVGKAAPVAYALDGFPIYGQFDPAAKSGDEKCCPLGGRDKLDELNGHYGASSKGPGPDGASTVAVPGLYHYHASVKYPYLNGGMRGKVTVKEGQVDPQPRATSPRPALPPLRGAKITGFKTMGQDSTARSWSLEYQIAGKPGYVNFRIEEATAGDGDPAASGRRDTQYIFEFIYPDGTRKTGTFSARNGRGPGQGQGQGEREGNRPPRDRPDRGGGQGERGPRGRRAEAPDDAPPRDPQPGTTPSPTPSQTPTPNSPSKPVAGFMLTSSDVTDGRLSIECTCDSAKASRAPSLAWPEPPKGTKALAIVMHHITRDNDTHVYMVVANIPATARHFKIDDTQLSNAGHGTWGQNTVNRRNEYAPPCSQGPGDKTYTITLYALSADAKLPDTTRPVPLTRDTLLAAIKDTTLATATLDVKYARAK